MASTPTSLQGAPDDLPLRQEQRDQELHLASAADDGSGHYARSGQGGNAQTRSATRFRLRGGRSAPRSSEHGSPTARPRLRCSSNGFTTPTRLRKRDDRPWWRGIAPPHNSSSLGYGRSLCRREPVALAPHLLAVVAVDYHLDTVAASCRSPGVCSPSPDRRRWQVATERPLPAAKTTDATTTAGRWSRAHVPCRVSSVYPRRKRSRATPAAAA